MGVREQQESLKDLFNGVIVICTHRSPTPKTTKPLIFMLEVDFCFLSVAFSLLCATPSMQVAKSETQLNPEYVKDEV